MGLTSSCLLYSPLRSQGSHREVRWLRLEDTQSLITLESRALVGGFTLWPPSALAVSYHLICIRALPKTESCEAETDHHPCQHSSGPVQGFGISLPIPAPASFFNWKWNGDCEGMGEGSGNQYIHSHTEVISSAWMADLRVEHTQQRSGLTPVCFQESLPVVLGDNGIRDGSRFSCRQSKRLHPCTVVPFPPPLYLE